MASVSPRGGRAGRRRQVSEINVVPYIDVMLVLLVIFMVTAPMLPPGVVDLPSAGRSNQRPDAYVEVTVTGSGEMKVRARNRGDSPEMTVGRRELADAIRSVGGGELPVVISGDRQVRYEVIIEVMSELQKMNINRIALMVRPPGSGK